MNKFLSFFFGTKTRRITTKSVVNTIFPVLLAIFSKDIEFEPYYNIFLPKLDRYFYYSLTILLLIIGVNILFSYLSDKHRLVEIEENAIIRKKNSEIHRIKTNYNLFIENYKSLGEDYKTLSQNTRKIATALQHSREISRFDIKDLDAFYTGEEEMRYNTLIKWFEDSSVKLKFILTQIYWFLKTTTEDKNHEFRLSFMEPINDELDIACWANREDECPLTKAKKIKLKKGEGVAGKAWELFEKGEEGRLIIPNVEEELNNPESERIFKVLHNQHKFNIKSIFSIPIFNSHREHNFYGILNIDCNMIGNYYFKEYNKEKGDPVLEILKSYLDQIIYIYDKFNALKQKRFII